MYDFHKTRTKDKEKEFRHESLRKGRPDLLRFIKRKIGDETHQSNKAEQLVQKCKELEEKCKNFEGLAKLSIPIKKLKTVDSADCNVLCDGIMCFLDDKKSTMLEQKLLIDKATREYLEKVKDILAAPGSRPIPILDKPKDELVLAEQTETSCFDESSSCLSKRNSPSEHANTEDDHD